MKLFLLVISFATVILADIGEVVLVKGDAFVHRDTQSIKAQNEMSLFKQDTVETKQGRMQMQFIDDTVISLGKESRFRISEYFYEKENENIHASFTIEKGFVKTITGAIGKLMPESFVLNTSATTVHPHGTIWSVRVNDEGEHYKVLEGRITLNFNDGNEKQVTLKAGESLHLSIDASNPSKVIKSVKKNIKITQYEKRLELRTATISEDRNINNSTVINAKNELVFEDKIINDIVDGDGNRGHGNDPGGVDPDNPGNSQ